MKLSTNIPMELRGVQKLVSAKTNKPYFVANFEDTETGEPTPIYLGGDMNKLPSDVKKGDTFILNFDYNNKYKELNFISCERF